METGQCRDTLEVGVKGEPFHMGAEAVLYIVDWFGVKAVAKYRIAKPYRHKIIDEELRTRRTIVEAKALHTVRSIGVPAPEPYFVDPVAKLIIMEYIEGVKLADIVESHPDRAQGYVEALGKYTAHMHSIGVAHGDLTTSNTLVTSSGQVFIIDFGLSSLKADDHDKAVDIHLFIRSLESTHPEHVGDMLEYFLKGYSSILGSSKTAKLMEIVEEIRLMGRYHEERRSEDNSVRDTE